MRKNLGKFRGPAEVDRTLYLTRPLGWKLAHES